MKKYIYYLFFISILVSCEKNENISESEAEVNEIIIDNSKSNNSAILSGGTLGTQKFENHEIWKSGEVILETPSTEFEIDSVYFYKLGNHVYLTIPITNVSSESHHTIYANDVRVLDADDKIIYKGKYGLSVKGSQGHWDDSRSKYLTNNFLGVGERGYFVDIERLDFDKVAKVKIAEIELRYKYLKYIPSKDTVVPTSYVIENTDELTVNLENKSDKKISLARYSQYTVILNDKLQPITWTTLRYDFDKRISEKFLLPKEKGFLQNLYLFKGSATKIETKLNFKIVESIEDSKSESYKEEYIMYEGMLNEDNRIKEKLIRMSKELNNN